jgi:hypothetical protein
MILAFFGDAILCHYRPCHFVLKSKNYGSSFCHYSQCSVGSHRRHWHHMVEGTTLTYLGVPFYPHPSAVGELATELCGIPKLLPSSYAMIFVTFTIWYSLMSDQLS